MSMTYHCPVCNIECVKNQIKPTSIFSYSCPINMDENNELEHKYTVVYLIDAAMIYGETIVIGDYAAIYVYINHELNIINNSLDINKCFKHNLGFRDTNKLVSVEQIQNFLLLY